MTFSKDLVSSHYLDLLNDVILGVPHRILQVACSVNSINDLDNLLLRLNRPLVSNIRTKAIAKIEDKLVFNREETLRLADKAKVESRFRLSVKYYGVITLMSGEADGPLKWSIFHLRDLCEHHYGIALPTSNSDFLKLIGASS